MSTVPFPTAGPRDHHHRVRFWRNAV